MAGNVVLSALRHVWTTLEPLQAPMAVMGGLALSAWEHVRTTQDVDLLIAIEHTRVRDLLDRLTPAGFRPKRQPPLLALGDLHLLQMQYEPQGSFLDLQVDLLLAESEYHRVALSRRVVTRLPGLDIAIAILTCEDLVLHKLLAGRIVDRADGVALLAANRGALDREFLVQWSKRLNLTRELADVWHAAIPDEPLQTR